VTNAPDIALVIVILVAGFIIGKVVGKLIAAIIRKTGLINVIRGSKAQEQTKKTGFILVTFIELIVRWTIYLIAITQAIEILGLEQFTSFTQDIVKYLPNVIVALVIVIIGFVVAEKAVVALEDFFAESKLPRNIIISNSVRYFIYIIVVIMALSQLKISTLVLVVIAAVLSILGAIFVMMGARDISSNFFAGVQIIWYKSIRVGDLIHTDGIEGIVEEIGILSTTVKTEGGDYLIVPNAMIANNVVVKKIG